MTAEAGVEQELLSLAWFGEFEEEYAAGEIVDIGDTECRERIGEFFGNDLQEISRTRRSSAG